MTDLMKAKLKELEKLKNQREKIKVDDLKTLELYQSLDEGDLFSKAYEKVVAEAVHRGEYGYKFKIEELYRTHYNKINTGESIDSKIDSFRKSNPLRIKK